MNKSKQADTFLTLTESLSRYRRAELKNEKSENLIEELYVDPLENDLVFKSMLQNNTTLLIGRKGTGKSTIINRFQHEIRKSDDKLSLYIDVKALFEQAKNSSFSSPYSEQSLSQKNIEKLNLYIVFIEKIINEINQEIKKGLFTNPIKNFFIKEGITKNEFEKQLDLLFKEVKKASYIDITSTKESQQSSRTTDSTQFSVGLSASASVEKQEVKASINNDSKNEIVNSQEFTKILSRYFNIIDFMNRLKKLLSKIPINNVFICLDDMSEIDKNSMEVFTEFIIGPLNNLSDEYFKFKISLYPGRDYLPTIDRQKVKTFNLDYYDLYSIGNADKVEELAQKYTKKLIERRFFHYYGKNVNLGDFYEITNEMKIDDYYRLLFQISSNVPRIIGKVLEIALQKTNSFERKINKKILQESAKQHYKNDIEYILTKSEYIEYKSYDEAFEQYHLLKLLNKIINKAIENKKHIGISTAKIFEKYNPNTAPSNYLYINENMENILKTLEFNFFITKYSSQKDREGNDVSVFSLNYGLCMDKNIIFDEKSDRKFRIERIFDFNSLIIDWMNESKELICEKCATTYPIEQKDIFIKYNVACQKCGGQVVFRPIIDEKEKQRLEKNIRIPKKEFEILNALNHKKSFTASELGYELDRAYQSINHSIGKNSKMAHYNFLERIEVKNRPYFSITPQGKAFLDGQLDDNTILG